MKVLKALGLTLLILVSCFLFGFSWRDIQHGEVPSVRAVNLLLGVKVSPDLSPEQVFKQNYRRILTNYDRTVKPQELKYAGMQGLMASLGDPHTIFLVPRAAEAFQDETRANFGGVGAKLQQDPLGAKVNTVFEDGPAFAAGLRSGDIIISVDGWSASSKDIEQIVEKIKGKEGTVVHLSIARKGSEKPVALTIKRAIIIAPTVESKYFADSKVGRLAIAAFAEPTASQFDKELRKLEQNDMKGLVIDLRENPGGLLETARDMLSRFVEDKVVVRMKFRDGRTEEVRTLSGMKHDFSYPIVVLMNEDSASAAEIFAGCLRDYGAATLVGEHSYGKASVQNVFPLVDRSSAKITIARYFLPGGEFIGRKVDEDGIYQSGGLIPTVKVDLNMDAEFGDPKTDNQLAAAIQAVRGKP